jgi:hypothetical protein
MSQDDDVLSGLKRKPVRMTLSGPPPKWPGVDRRDHARRAALVRRILAEFDDMPGMSLSLRQAGRFLGIDEIACSRILVALTRDGHLRRNSSLQYVRADDAPFARAAH